jgi:4'-phosphopantetheinyl transferase EntD
MHVELKRNLRPSFIATTALAVDAWCRRLNPCIVHQIRHRGNENSTAERCSAQDAKAKRVREFEAGRLCAFAALATLGCDENVGVNPDRSPKWPDRFVGSISHSENWIWAGVASSDDVRSIGVDTEAIVSKETRNQIQQEIATPDEWSIAAAAGLTQEETFSLVFSAKEACYKCWYPLRREYFGFDQAVIEMASDDRLRIRLLESNPNYGHGPDCLDVFYFVDHENVFTATWMTKD